MKAYNDKIRIGLDITFIVLGLLFLTGVITLPSLGLWGIFLITLVGVLIASLPEKNAKRFGLGLALFGLYLILRSSGVIAVPILLWGLSIACHWFL
jgi:hypothetical protein